ncbi:MAG: GntR family transcriptional regulator [Bifidobacteriaceae bacterium]|jgi:DNA-binding GntR family transcriptional regulator|nr:GntR family transcriptional regulator [Bifidobacteriaceae bacterium]
MSPNFVPQIQIDRGSPVPLYHQVATQIEEAIRSGQLGVGTWLDNEVDLAARLGVSRPTMRQAISQLVEAGFLIRKRGVGTRVVSHSITRHMALTSLYTDLVNAGLKVVTTVQLIRPMNALGGLSDMFGLDERLLHIRRVRGTEDGPIGLMRNWIPASFDNVTAEALAQGGLYDLMRAGGADLKTAQQWVGARAATADEAKVLSTTKGAACVTLRRCTYDPLGRLLEIGEHLYRGDRYQFISTLTAR